MEGGLPTEFEVLSDTSFVGSLGGWGCPLNVVPPHHCVQSRESCSNSILHGVLEKLSELEIQSGPHGEMIFCSDVGMGVGSMDALGFVR